MTGTSSRTDYYGIHKKISSPEKVFPIHFQVGGDQKGLQMFRGYKFSHNSGQAIFLERFKRQEQTQGKSHFYQL